MKAIYLQALQSTTSKDNDVSHRVVDDGDDGDDSDTRSPRFSLPAKLHSPLRSPVRNTMNSTMNNTQYHGSEQSGVNDGSSSGGGKSGKNNGGSTVVADMKLTKDHIGLVAKYFDNPEDALELLAHTLDPSPSNTPHQKQSTNPQRSPTNISSSNSGRISPVQVNNSSNQLKSQVNKQASKPVETSLRPLQIDRQDPNLESGFLPLKGQGSSSQVNTPKTGDSRYQSVDALLDWAKDLDMADDFLKNF
jgi:hypothetical protein